MKLRRDMMSGMSEYVTISTGARLHFGPLAVRAEIGPSFGGLGMMVDRPGWIITLGRADRDELDAGPDAERIARILADFRSQSKNTNVRVHLNVEQRVPAHAGFGSGTQLALAVGRGLVALSDESEPAAVDLARRTGRGRRSAIGIHGFERGGLIVDAGHRASHGVGDLACRVAVPEEWRFVLVTPPQQGLSGVQETAAFERLPPMPGELTGRLCRLVLCEVLPALQQSDFARFAAAISEYGSLAGRYFEPVQGGVFVDPSMHALAKEVHSRFECGCAQTSWGPTAAVLCPSLAVAGAVAHAVHNDARWRECTVITAAGLNHGAMCDIHGEDSGSARGAG